jgi:glyceraldehyde-3-phosphate dehydrogenase/erythrose-4-phosphate dehydrogenase
VALLLEHNVTLAGISRSTASRVINEHPGVRPAVRELVRRTLMARIAIHGFGRIGRSLMKVALKNNLFTPVSISDIKDIPTLAALFEVDSNYGRWHEEVVATADGFVIVGDPHSSIVDLPLTAVQEELLSVAAWYDNEMGYSTRLAETAALIAG